MVEPRAILENGWHCHPDSSCARGSTLCNYTTSIYHNCCYGSKEVLR